MTDKKQIKTKQLAIKLGVHRSTVWRWSTGRKKCPKAIRMIMPVVCAALDIQQPRWSK